MRVRFLGFAHTSVYRAEGEAPWVAGDEREVSEERGVGLCVDFPGDFVHVEPAAVDPPRITREVKRAPRRK